MMAALIARFWPLAAVVFVVGVVLGMAYAKGRADANAACAAAELAGRVAALKADLELARRAAEDAARLQTEAEQTARNANEEARRYADQLAARPNQVCALTPDDVDSLLRIGTGRR